VNLKPHKNLAMGIFTKFVSKLKGESTASAAAWGDLEAELLAADLGPTLTAKLMVASKKIKGDDAERALREILKSSLSTKSRELARGTSTNIVMVVGVNGTGKTTSVAKLASHLKSQNKSVVLGAGDTFRAAAVDQLKTWGARIGVEVVAGGEKSDPASVAFDAAKLALEKGTDYLILDTAGRLHNKSDLMAELGKIKRVIEKSSPIAETLLVIDATTGQNGIAQAKTFAEVTDVTGLIVTKLDGSARGGVALAIESELDIPIKFVGTGESEGDFAPFVTDMFIDGLLA
jgi:fused signal recognition particle receptor